MDRPPLIGWYVHHHGSGHRQRTLQLLDGLDARVHVLTSAPAPFEGHTDVERVIVLPDDAVPGDHTPSCDTFHYTPMGVPVVQRRMRRIANWLADEAPDLLVVDLSVEVTLLARLFGVRTCVVRLHGERTDTAHVQCFRSAERILAPFPACMEDAHTPEWLRAKTTYLGGFSRFDRRELPVSAAREQIGYALEHPLVVVANGLGGASHPLPYWIRVAESHPGYQWLLIGKSPEDPPTLPDNLYLQGFVTDTFPYLRAADYVVGSAGTNTVMEVAAARNRYISLPEPRPFAEQLCKARTLENLGTAVVRTNRPAVPDWTDLFARADQLDLDRWNQVRRTGRLAAVREELCKLASRSHSDYGTYSPPIRSAL